MRLAEIYIKLLMFCRPSYEDLIITCKVREVYAGYHYAKFVNSNPFKTENKMK